jgi:hypothetical protein
MTDQNLLQRIDRIESYIQIQQLPSRYAVAVDSRDIDTWVNLFVDDVRVTKETTGRDALRAMIDSHTRTFYRSHHQICGHVIDFIDADNATGKVYCRAEHEDRGRWIVMAICYFDRYERRDGIWYFRKRDEQHWYSTDVLERPSGPDFQQWPGPWKNNTPNLPGRFPTWGEFWSRSEPELIDELTKLPVGSTTK